MCLLICLWDEPPSSAIVFDRILWFRLRSLSHRSSKPWPFCFNGDGARNRSVFPSMIWVTENRFAQVGGNRIYRQRGHTATTTRVARTKTTTRITSFLNERPRPALIFPPFKRRNNSIGRFVPVVYAGFLQPNIFSSEYVLPVRVHNDHTRVYSHRNFNIHTRLSCIPFFRHAPVQCKRRLGEWGRGGRGCSLKKGPDRAKSIRSYF